MRRKIQLELTIVDGAQDVAGDSYRVFAGPENASLVLRVDLDETLDYRGQARQLLRKATEIVELAGARLGPPARLAGPRKVADPPDEDLADEPASSVHG